MSYLLRTLGFSFAVATSMLFLVAQLKAEIYPPNCAGANASELELYVNIGGPVHVNEIIDNPMCLTNAFGPADNGYPYNVQASDLVSIDPAFCPPTPGPVPAIVATASGAAVVLNGTINGAKSYQSCALDEVNFPCISCTQNCTNTAEPGVITFGGSILNCSTNAVLAGITASNLVIGTLVNLTLSTNQLGFNQRATFSGSYTNPNPCSLITNTILVRGYDRDTGQLIPNSCVSTCGGCLSPPYLKVCVKTLRLTLFVVPGKTNQLESSPDLHTWTAYGAPFVNNSSTFFQDVEVLSERSYFRIQQVP